jgi:hypothetical protein
MSIDRADWHYDGDFPTDLPIENGATHIGMYLTWIIKNNLQSEFLDEEMPEAINDLRKRKISGRDFLLDYCDEKFTEEELSEEGLAFTEDYYSEDYISDYEATLADGLASIYYVENSWENYDKIAPAISKRFNEWKKKKH